MGYRGYRSWRSREWRTHQPSKYTLLTRLFGDAVDAIRKAFLDLDADAKDELFLDYGAIHGDSAERYARKTFPAWRSGATKLSGQTMERLVELVPPYLPSSVRLQILKLVLVKNKPRGTFATVKINIKEPTEGFVLLDAEISRMNISDDLAYLPEKVMEAATWLYDNDVTAARAMLAEATKIENEMLKRNAVKEIDLLKRTIKNGQIKSANYNVDMPAGSLSVVATSPSILSTIFSVFK
jgi:hypothetical protein